MKFCSVITISLGGIFHADYMKNAALIMKILKSILISVNMP